jgi:hypothetical protein
MPDEPDTDSIAPRVCVVLGTGHEIQETYKGMPGKLRCLSDNLASVIEELVDRHRVKLIAEEAPISTPTRAHEIADRTGIEYLQVDTLMSAAGQRYDKTFEFRFCKTDEDREKLWLEKIGRNKLTPVLLVCGYAHSFRPFIPQKLIDSGWKVEGPLFLPAALAGRESHLRCCPPFADKCGEGCAHRL